MDEAKAKVLTLDVRLKPSDPIAHPRATNYTKDRVEENHLRGLCFHRTGTAQAYYDNCEERSGGTEWHRRAAYYACGDGHRCARSPAPEDTASLDKYAGCAAGGTEELR